MSAAEVQQNRAVSFLEYQTEVEVEFHIEDEKTAEIKNQVQTVKISQQQQANHSVEGGNRSAETVSKCKL